MSVVDHFARTCDRSLSRACDAASARRQFAIATTTIVFAGAACAALWIGAARPLRPQAGMALVIRIEAGDARQIFGSLPRTLVPDEPRKAKEKAPAPPAPPTALFASAASGTR
jgi:hypothetical protein